MSDVESRGNIAAMAASPASTADRPAEVLAFLFTDIEGSSLRWLDHRVAMQSAVRMHDDLLRDAIRAFDGEVFKTTGDGFYAAFRLPAGALSAAIAAQQALAARDWSGVGGLTVRMAVHVGTAERRGDDYFGPALNRVARLLALGHGGQVLLTSSAAELILAEREHAYALRSLGAHPLDDPHQPVELHQVDVRGLRCEFPPLRTIANRRSNLPRQTSELIGRQAEVSDLQRRLGRARLVTLTGAGGVGKTRLALDVGERLLDRYADGVWLVELAPLVAGDLVASAVATALRIESYGELGALDLIVSRLRDQELLLVLDNCEHVVDAVARLVDALLAAAPRVAVLASSQEALGLSGENVYQVSSLPVPDPGPLTAERALAFGALRLFVERVQAADAHFVLDDASAPVVAAICRRVDGIPLAIEMAAARASTLGVDTLAARLDERFRVLTRGQRTALPRHQTLRATLDWSHSLLAPGEQQILRRLAVFAGGFTADAAARVASDEATDELAVIDGLSHLVARSLVVAERDLDATRFRLLESTRAYALEKLESAGEYNALRRRHAEYCLGVFERSFDEWSSLPDRDWRARYEPERDNLRAALDWALAPGGDSVLGVALMGASTRLWFQLSLFSESRERFDALAQYVTAETPPAIAARFWAGMGTVWYDGEAARTTVALERAIELLRTAVDDPPLLGEALSRLGSLLVTPLHTREVGRAMIEEARPLLERAGRPRLLARYFVGISHLLFMEHDAAASLEAQERALELFRAAGAERDALMVMSNIADMIWARGDLSEAIRVMREIIERVRQSPVATRSSLANPLANLAGVLTEVGDVAEALATAREAVPVLREDGSHWLYFDHFALRLALEGRFDDAARLEGFADAAHRAREECPRQPNEERLRVRLVDLLQKQLAPDRLERLLAEGAKLSDDDACRIAMEA
jgi:predicted ATPase